MVDIPKFLRRIDPRTRVGGIIGGLDLGQWWADTFSAEERNQIQKAFNRANGVKGSSLTRGAINMDGVEPGGRLAELAGAVRDDIAPEVALRILQKARAVLEAGPPDSSSSREKAKARHYLYRDTIELLYREAAPGPPSPASLLDLAEKQVELAPKVAELLRRESPDSPLPEHRGFRELVTIRERQAKLAEALYLCQKAEREGWGGVDWEGRSRDIAAKIRVREDEKSR